VSILAPPSPGVARPERRGCVEGASQTKVVATPASAAISNAAVLDPVDARELAKLYRETRTAAEALKAQITKVLKLAERLEELTKDTPSWYAGTRARVEARATMEQVQELRRALEELGERLGE
jgi:hypothetical protein